MSEPLQEFVDCRSQRLRVDRAAGVIRGVKLLGLSSRNGRRYRKTALVEAVGLYEGAKVNINHPKGHPLSPRDYQDRLGEIRGVQFRDGGGLFGDLHFNPKHALSEQLMWDAEHAPQNVGLSHNVLARTSRDGDETAIEEITKVQSIDLVADPATTDGLFEHSEGRESSVKGRGPDVCNSGSVLDGKTFSLASLTLEELRLHRPDLVGELDRVHSMQLEEMQQRIDDLAARAATAQRRERILELIQEHDLPLPVSDGVTESLLVSPQFIEMLMRAPNEECLRRLVEERASLVRSACDWSGRHRRDQQPRSRDQLAILHTMEKNRPHTSKQFAAAIRGR